MPMRPLAASLIALPLLLGSCSSSPDAPAAADCESDPLFESAAAPTDADLQHCVDGINGYRAAHGKAALARDPAIEHFARQGACWDSHTREAHSHFSAKVDAYVIDAENEVPWWPLQSTLADIVDRGAKVMMDEGPGGGHYENILGNHTKVGCGIYQARDNTVTVVQDFK